jgi:branched-chain amino acid transport system substrate-binding protein
MRRLSISLICLFLVFALYGAGMAETLKIGTLSPLTGPYAQDGTDILQGVKTAVAVFEKSGSVPGFDKIEVIPGDSACDGGKATLAANKLINSAVHGVIGAYCSSATIPASVPLNEANIIQITPASTHTDVTARGFKQIFRMPPRDDVQAWSSVKFFENGLKIKTVALIDDRQTYTVGLTENITKFIKENNQIQIVAHEHITPGDKDFTAVLTNLKKINPDLIYMGVYQPEGSLMVRQIKALGITSKLLSEDAVFHPKFIEVGGEAAEGTFLTFAKAPETQMRKDFETTYKEMWKVDSVGSYAYYAYDAAMILIQAIKKAGTTKTDTVAATLRDNSWEGVSGDIKFDEKGDRKLAHVIWVVKDGKFVPYWDPLTEKLF